MSLPAPEPAVDKRLADARAYFEMLWGDHEDGALVVWYQPQGGHPKTQWFDPGPDVADQAARFCVGLTPGTTVYAGLASRWQRIPGVTQGSNSDCSNVSVLFLDIDIGGQANGHNGKAPQPATAQQVLDLFGVPHRDSNPNGLRWPGEMRPSGVVLSGGGVHLYWKLDEPVSVDAAKRINRQLEYTADQRAREFGWGIDAISKPNQLMRVVGTVNVKKDRPDPRPVELFAIDPTRTYSIDAFDWLDEMPERNVPGGDRVMESAPPDRNLPGDRWNHCYTVVHELTDFAGWSWYEDRERYELWTHPDATNDYSGSAVRNSVGKAFFTPFSPNTIFEQFEPMDMLRMFAVMFFRGDAAKAGRALNVIDWPCPDDPARRLACIRAVIADASNGVLEALLDADPMEQGRAKLRYRKLAGYDMAADNVLTMPPMGPPQSPPVDHHDDPQTGDDGAAAEDEDGEAQHVAHPDRVIPPTSVLSTMGFLRGRLLVDRLEYVWPHLDGGVEPVAYGRTDEDGNIARIFLLDPILQKLPGAVVNKPLDGFELIEQLVPEGDVAVELLRNADQPDALWPPLISRLWEATIGAGAVSREPTWKWATAREIVKRAKPKPEHLRRADDGVPLLYEKKTNIVFGPSETTKTWLCALAALQCIRAGRKVLWIDLEEIGYSQGAYRLELLGATDGEMDMLVNLDDFMPEIISSDYGRRIINVANRQGLLDKIEAEKIGLVIIDSLSELAGSQDLDDNSKQDMSYLRNHVIAHIARLCAVFMIDHTGHTTGARESGTVQKKNAADGLRIYIEQTERFMPGRNGRARLWAMKDRWGQVYPHCIEGDHQFDGEKKKGPKLLLGVFELTSGSPVAAAIRKPVEADMPDVNGVVARAEIAAQRVASGLAPTYQGGDKPGTEDVLIEMLVRGDFGSMRDAWNRLDAALGIKRTAVETLLQRLQNDGFVVLGEAKSGQKRGIHLVHSKVPQHLRDEAARRMQKGPDVLDGGGR